MRNTSFPILLIASFALATPSYADTDLGKIVSGVAQSLIAQEADRSAFIAAQNQNTIPGYRNYLTKFPKGAYRGNAEQALAKLGVKDEPSKPPVIGSNQSPASIEASIGLTRAQRILIQKQLTALGYPTGIADGLWGSNTRNAIGRWQKAHKNPVTGYLTVKQVNKISSEAGANVGNGQSGTTVSDDPIEERLLSLTYDERRDVQRRLSLLGYNTRGVDGSFGNNTRQALAAWQRDEGLRVSGYLTADQLRALRRDTGG